MKAPNDYLDDLSEIDMLRRTRHQRDGKLGRLVRIRAVNLGHSVRPTEEEIICTVICWVPEDHYLVALPSRYENGPGTAIVSCGACVDA